MPLEATPEQRAAADAAGIGAPIMPVRVDLRALAATDPQPPKFIWELWLQQGEVALFAGHGGAGKSMLLLFILVCIALGRNLWGSRVERRRVGIFSFEDGADVLHWRLSRICALLGVALPDLDGWLLVFDGTEADATMAQSTPDGLMTTATYAWVGDRIKLDAIEVLAIDGAADVYAGNENSRSEVKKFIRLLRRLIPRTGAVVLLAHVNRITAEAGARSEGYSGSTAWHNSVRNRWFLYPERDEEGEAADVILESQKANSARAGAQIRLRWSEAAGLFVVNESVPRTSLERELAKIDVRDTIVRMIGEAYDRGDPVPAAAAGPRTTYRVMSAMAGFPESLRGAGKARFQRVIEELRQGGRITVAGWRGKDRHTVNVLVVGNPACGSSATAGTPALRESSGGYGGTISRTELPHSRGTPAELPRELPHSGAVLGH